MHRNIELTRVLFLDIETVSEKAKYIELDPDWQALWGIKAKQILRSSEPILDEEILSKLYEERAGIFSEFGKIACISVGILLRDSDSKELNVRLTSFKDPDEKVLLESFVKMLEQYYPDPNIYFLCGHNIREFDIPYICRRMILHKVRFPQVLEISGKKPWETKFILDTLEMWRFGDFKNYTSMKLLTKLLDVPSPKDDIDGSEVGRVFWQEGNIDRIATYCEKDVLAVIQLMMRYKGLPLLDSMNIVHV